MMQRRASGFSLVELLISVVIGAIALLAMVQTLGLQDANRRAVVGGNDTAQVGAYSLYLFDDLARSAASNVQQGGIAEGITTLSVGTPTSYGCELRGTLPSGGSFGALALAAPFDTLPVGGTMRLSPVLLQQTAGSNSHRLALLRGSVSVLGTTIVVSAESAPGVLEVPSTLGLRAGEWLLGVESSGLFGRPCTIARIADAPDVRTLANRDNSLLVRLASGTTFGWTVGEEPGTLSSLGPAPQFDLYAVDDTSRRLMALDLFQAALTPRVVAENVVVLRGMYGIDDGAAGGSVDPDGIVDRWVLPTDDYAYESLTDGSGQAADRIRRIAAVRLGLVLRQPMRQGQDSSATPTASLFGGLPGVTAEDYTVTDTLYRARAIEFTLHLRSAALAGSTLPLMKAIR
ncbi:MAG: PilW family protein [Burkholderiales bacterium]|nr:PilW family protein [Burkholderiales bacterium]